MSETYRSHTVMELHVRNKQDMQEIEEAIIKQLGGEGHRCAFLRSRSYIKLRVAALYQTHSSNTSHAAFHGRLSVLMVPQEGGSPLVSVLWLDRVGHLGSDQEDGLDAQAGGAGGAGVFEDGCQKRRRQGRESGI